jgi:hypothetical protein
MNSEGGSGLNILKELVIDIFSKCPSRSANHIVYFVDFFTNVPLHSGF